MNTTTMNATMPLARVGKIWTFVPWISRLFLLPPMIIMTRISLRCILDPVHAIAEAGVALSTPEALTDTRVIGGLTLTLGAIIAWAVFSHDRLRMGHVVVITLMALVLSVRMFGFVHDGTTLAMGTQKVKTSGEIVFLILNAVGFALQTYRMKRVGITQ